MDFPEIYNKYPVLFLEGVFLDDIIPIEDIFDKRLIEQIEVKTVKYKPIPSRLEEISSWPTKTNIKCAYCTLNFNNMPWIEPSSIGRSNIEKPLQEMEHFRCNYFIDKEGTECYCSVGCVMGKIIKSKYTSSVKKDKIAMLKIEYRILTGKSPPPIIKPTNSHTDMDQYGGNMTEDQYKSKIFSSNNSEISNKNVDVNVLYKILTSNDDNILLNT